MKRKAEQIDDFNGSGRAKRRATTIQERFREGLFDQDVLDTYTKSYHNSTP